jgi:hypothetical protein
MAGRKTLRSLRMARETSNGTRATPRYLWRGVGDWVVDEREIVKVEEQVGISGGTDRTYTPKLAASVEIAETEATYKQIVSLFYSLGLTPRAAYNTFGTRVPALYNGASGSIWRYGLNVPSTVFPTTYSYTIEAGDNIEAQVALYCVTDELKLTFEAGQAAKISASMLAQYGTRTNAEGSFSEVGTLENVTVMLSSKTHSFDITPVTQTSTFVQITAATVGSRTRFWVSSVGVNGPGAGIIVYEANEAFMTYRSSLASDFLGVWALNATNIWAVGGNGSIVYYNGSTWASQTSGTSSRLYDVSGIDSSNVWAVGDDLVLYYNGTSWTSQSTTAGSNRAVWAQSASDVWVVGLAGIIRYYNGSTWASQTSGTAANLRAVHGISDSAVWAVGDNGTIRYYNGSTWASQTSGTTENLRGVYAIDASNVWAVGNNGTILFFNGSAWSAQTSGVSVDLYSLWGSSASSMFAVGANETWLQWNGATWTQLGSRYISETGSTGNVLKGELTVKAQWAPKYWVDAGVLYPGTMVLTGHEITGNLTFEHQNSGTLSAAGSAGQIEKWRNQQAQLLNMMWLDYDSFGSEVAFGLQLPFKWDNLQDYDDMDGNNIVSGDFTSKYNEIYASRGFFFFHTGWDYSNIVGTI